MANGRKLGVGDWAITLIFGLIVLAVPLQALLEAIYWLRYGEWVGWDLQSVLSEKFLQQIDEIEWVGVRYVVRQAVDIWMSVYVTIAVFLFIIWAAFREGWW